jgi:hypothetical protein
MAQAISMRFAVSITPHGYGHAARASAVMNAIREMEPGAFFEIYTRVPVWFFKMSLQDGFNYHEVLTDIGLAQKTAMEVDLHDTIQQLGAFLPFAQPLVDELAQQVRLQGCEKLICDIAPLGIAVARKAGIPSILVENFTWDWIYEGYLEEEPRLAPYIAYLKDNFAAADHHIRTQPACDFRTPAHLLSEVVSRKPRRPADETRRQLGIPQDSRLVMLTMGGILTQYPFLEAIKQAQDVLFLIPGGSDRYEMRGSLVLIPHHSDLYHPDLVAASDVIVGKLGYSTLAEAYAAGVTYIYIPRANFPESPPMAEFARETMGAVELAEERFFSGDWLDLLPGLLSRPRHAPEGPNGADQIAQFVLA